MGPSGEFDPPLICLMVTVQRPSSSMQSLVPVEMLVRGSHEDMQGLLYLQLLGSSGLVKDGGPTPLDGMLGFPGIPCYR